MSSLPQKMIDAYLQRRSADLELLKKSLENGSTEEFRRIGHQLAGNAKSFGFNALEVIALKMEKMQLSDLNIYGPSLIEEFSYWLENELKSSQP